MADYKKITPFERQVEGGLSNDPKDYAAKFPCPFPYNGKTYHTNKGWTWAVWSSLVGSTQASANRFFVMTDEDWDFLYKKQYFLYRGY